MSFRKEEKIHIHKNQLHNFLGWIYKNNGFKLHDNRIVSSTYLDNDQMRMFIDSEEGNLPRKKLELEATQRNHTILEKVLWKLKLHQLRGDTNL